MSQKVDEVLAYLSRLHEGSQLARFVEMERSTRAPGQVNARSREDIDYMQMLFREARPFIFHGYGENTSGMEDLDSKPGTEILDLPFAVCSFEGYKKPLVALNDQSNGELYQFSCVLVHEVAPKTYNFRVLATMVTERGIEVEVLKYHSNDAVLMKAVDDLLKMLTRCKWGTEKTSSRIKVGGEVRKLKTIIHIVPKKLIDSVSAQVRPITWDHRWEVRGHWRAFYMPGSFDVDTSKVGKDRSGAYNVKGFTWVQEHERGPENLPLIRKSRALVEDNNSFPYYPQRLK